MYKRILNYLNERFHIIPRLILGYIVFFEIVYIVILNAGIRDIKFGIEDFIGGYTVFGFLLWLRIADDIKDYDIDKVLFPERPLPRGSVGIKELHWFCFFIQVSVFVLNLIFMNNC